jgi:hypothetical protein
MSVQEFHSEEAAQRAVSESFPEKAGNAAGWQLVFEFAQPLSGTRSRDWICQYCQRSNFSRCASFPYALLSLKVQLSLLKGTPFLKTNVSGVLAQKPGIHMSLQAEGEVRCMGLPL